jgi:hypothetical protein
MHGIAKWDGQTWTPVGDGVDGKVSSLATFKSADSKSVLLAGGPFFRGRAVGNLDQDSEMITYLGSWDGTKWQPFGILKNFRPNTMIVLPSETTIVVGGADFDNNREVFLWSVNGTEWSAKLTLDSIPQDPTRVHRICSAIALHRFEDSLPSHDALVVGFQLSETRHRPNRVSFGELVIHGSLLVNRSSSEGYMLRLIRWRPQVSSDQNSKY